MPTTENAQKLEKLMPKPTLMDWYFNFESDHTLKDGTPIGDFYVKVTARDLMEAKALYIKNFSIPILDNPFLYKSQLTKEQFDKVAGGSPKGELCHISIDHPMPAFFIKCAFCEADLNKSYSDTTLCKICHREHYR